MKLTVDQMVKTTPASTLTAPINRSLSDNSRALNSLATSALDPEPVTVTHPFDIANVLVNLAPGCSIAEPTLSSAQKHPTLPLWARDRADDRTSLPIGPFPVRVRTAV
jgi:hypothetical protein